MTLQAVFVPAPRDRMWDLLSARVIPGVELSRLDVSEGSEAAASMLARADAVALGPGMEETVGPALSGSALKLSQFTGCWQDPEVVGALQGQGGVVASAAPALAPYAARHTLSLIQRALSVARGAGADLRGMTVGIVGLGHVGTAVGGLLRAAGARLVYHDIRTAPQGVATELGARRVTLDRLLATSDIVTLHVSATPHSVDMIGTRELRLMKSDAVIVNTSRPETIVEDDLVERLASGRIGAAAIGVHRGRAPGQASPFEPLDQLVVDTAAAHDVPEAAVDVADLVAENLRRLAAGEDPRSVMELVEYPGAGDPSFWSSRLWPRQMA